MVMMKLSLFDVGIGKVHLSSGIIHPRLSNRRTQGCKTRSSFVILSEYFISNCDISSFHLSFVIIWNMNTNSWRSRKRNERFGWRCYAMQCKNIIRFDWSTILFVVIDVPIQNCSKMDIIFKWNHSMKSIHVVIFVNDIYGTTKHQFRDLININDFLSSGIFYQGYECSRCQKKLHRDCIKKLPPCFQRSISIFRSRKSFIIEYV